MQCNLTGPPPIAVFPQIDPLPGTQYWRLAPDRDRQVNAGKNGTNMGRHVVGPFRVVAVPFRAAMRSQTCDGVLQIRKNVWISVLLNGQRSRGVLDQ